eukprot:5553305-Amphidinium_carterae.2
MSADTDYGEPSHLCRVFESVLGELQTASRTAPKLSRWFAFDHFLQHEGLAACSSLLRFTTWLGWYRGWFKTWADTLGSHSAQSGSADIVAVEEAHEAAANGSGVTAGADVDA